MGKYDDIINLPHYVSPTRQKMPIADRAAQFSPFAALTGYEDAVEETARVTDKQIEMSEEAKASINRKLRIISDHPGMQICVTYFKPDERKSGGEYLTFTGKAKHIDEYERKLVFDDKTSIFIDVILDIEGDGLDKS